MRAYYLQILNRNLHLFLTVVTVLVCGLAILESREARQLVEKPLLIAIDSNGTRVISRADDPIFDTELAQFAQMFFSLLYNFTPETYTKSVGQASGYMSLKLWTDKESELLELARTVKAQAISLTGTLRGNVSVLKDGAYKVQLQTTETTRMSQQTRLLEVRFEVVRVARSEANPWGIEVTSYDEQLIN